MSGIGLYLSFPGTAAEALGFYARAFDAEVELHTFDEFGRTDGPADAIAHGVLSGPVGLFASDTAGDEEPVSMTGVSVTLLGTADGETLTRWFERLSDGGTVLDPLQKRPWGATDGQVRDRYGVRWLVGYED
ncbi:VOC family protein [Labedella endophytica]|uniref:VOC family protein n=1 Tax=Labedella endophytica TaxID=1523160 RepID=A0A3S0WYG1_9MICO|nr:VOC family protein [Labedella endophytica]RUR01121.1 VOC family protein [Labedella endophytica]